VGDAYSGKGEHDRAIADYDQAISLDPKFVLAWNGRGNAHAGEGDYDSAIADFDEALKLDPDFTDARESRWRAQAALASRR
jgi:tetratricopeptide (TPR) repeat protein